MIYCDSSALVKLVVEEPESGALDEWLSAQRSVQLASSIIARTEVVRAVARYGEKWVTAAFELLTTVTIVELDRSLTDEAAVLGVPGLRTLDALHLAAALRIGPAITAFIAYDHRLADAARAHGLPVVTPRPRAAQGL
ncbi:type II toxin-antitoxin system VapC family toxin [Pseudonocardia sichuanensis]